jgi:hypothetical protein
MSDIPGIFDSLYSRLVLRDVFAKILPGTIVSAAVAYAALPPDTFFALLDPSLFLALGMMGCGWLAAFAIQGLGEKYKFIKNEPPGLNRQQLYERMVEFERKSSPSQQMHAERLLVIKEACGNGYLALSLSVLLTILLWPLRVVATGASLTLRSSWWPFVPLSILYIVAALSLRFMNRSHAKHHLKYMNVVIASAQDLPAGR